MGFITVKKYAGIQYYISKTKKINGRHDKCYYMKYDNAYGRTVREKIGWESDGITATYAAHIRSERIRKSRLGEEIITFHDRKRHAVSFKSFAEEKYLPYVKDNKKEKSYIGEKQILNNWIYPAIGNKTLQEISSMNLESLKKTMKGNDKALRTIEYVLAIVRQIFNAAIQWDIFKGKNPVTKIKIQKEDNRRVRFLSKEEAETILVECRKKSQKTYEVVLLALSCGLRAGEIANLKWQDIDIENKTITVKDTKNNINRTAYMTDKVLALFNNKKAELPNNYIFTDSNGSRSVDIARTIGFRNIIKRLGFNDNITDRRNKVVFHSLRHTFASWLAISGVPIYTIKELMGHKTLAMTERYAHLMPNTKRDAVKKIDGMFSDN
ncbi:MAG: site-specific integrase [Chlorobi bacterium]|nr:site-specific integrase [Chlorobiota bacterium]